MASGSATARANAGVVPFGSAQGQNDKQKRRQMQLQKQKQILRHPTPASKKRSPGTPFRRRMTTKKRGQDLLQSEANTCLKMRATPTQNEVNTYGWLVGGGGFAGGFEAFCQED
jgi:hypothetical protein